MPDIQFKPYNYEKDTWLYNRLHTKDSFRSSSSEHEIKRSFQQAQLLVPMPKCLKFKNKGLRIQYRYQKYLQKDLRKNQQLLTTTAIADMK